MFGSVCSEALIALFTREAVQLLQRSQHGCCCEQSVAWLSLSRGELILPFKQIVIQHLPYLNSLCALFHDKSLLDLLSH